MATTEQADTEQCRALTDDGGRCSRPARDDGFCYQHDESDPTVDEQEADDEGTGSDEATGSDGEGGGDSVDGGGEESGDEGGEEAIRESDRPIEEDDRTVSEAELEESDSTILGVRRTVEGTATGLIGQPLDSITEVTATEDGWRAIVEVVERSSVPDTQDILGQYEIDLSDDIEVQGYRRIDRYRRSDTDK